MRPLNRVFCGGAGGVGGGRLPPTKIEGDAAIDRCPAAPQANATAAATAGAFPLPTGQAAASPQQGRGTSPRAGVSREGGACVHRGGAAGPHDVHGVGRLVTSSSKITSRRQPGSPPPRPRYYACEVTRGRPRTQAAARGCPRPAQPRRQVATGDTRRHGVTAPSSQHRNNNIIKMIVINLSGRNVLMNPRPCSRCMLFHDAPKDTLLPGAAMVGQAVARRPLAVRPFSTRCGCFRPQSFQLDPVLTSFGNPPPLPPHIHTHTWPGRPC